MTYQISTSPASVYTAGTIRFSVTGAEAGAAYRWSLGDGTNTTETQPTHTYRTAGTYIVTVAITENGETTTIAKDITVSTPTAPTITISESGEKYVASDITFTAEISGGEPNDYTRLWDFGDGVTTTAETPTHAYQRPGTYAVCLFVSSNTGAIVTRAEKAITIKQPSKPTVSVTVSANRQYTPAEITFTGRITGGEPADYQSTWTFENGETENITGGATAPTTTRSISAGGNYHAVLTVSTRGGTIVSTAEAAIRILSPSAPTLTVALSHADPICEPTEITATATATGGEPTDYSYVWKVERHGYIASSAYGAGISSDFYGPETTTIASGTGARAVFTLYPSPLSQGGYFTLTYEVRYNYHPVEFDGARDYDSVTYTKNIYAVEAVYPVPVITATQISTYIALFENITEYINTTPASVTWNFGDGYIKEVTGDEMRRISHTYAATGAYAVSATLAYPGGTEHTAETTAILYALAAPAAARSMLSARRHSTNY